MHAKSMHFVVDRTYCSLQTKILCDGVQHSYATIRRSALWGCDFEADHDALVQVPSSNNVLFIIHKYVCESTNICNMFYLFHLIHYAQNGLQTIYTFSAIRLEIESN